MDRYLLVSVAEDLLKRVKIEFEKDIEKCGLTPPTSLSLFWNIKCKDEPLIKKVGSMSGSLLWTKTHHKKNRRINIDKKQVIPFDEDHIISYLKYLKCVGKSYYEIMENYLSNSDKKLVSDEDKHFQLNNLCKTFEEDVKKTKKLSIDFEENLLLKETNVTNIEYLLSYFEILELLCYIKTESDQTSNSDSIFSRKEIENNTPNLEEIKNLLKIISIEFSKNFCENVIPNLRSRPQLIYKMKLALENNQPMFFSKYELDLLGKYIWGLEFNIEKKYEPYNKPEVSKKMSMYEGTCWLVYYDAFVHERVSEHTLGVAIMEFSSFGNVRYKSLNRELSGHYYTYGDNYLIVNLKLNDGHIHHRRFIVYSGATKTEVMLGQYTYLEEIISANILMEFTNEKYDDFQAKYLTQQIQEFYKINPVIQKYFIANRLDGITSPQGRKEFSHVLSYLSQYIVK